MGKKETITIKPIKETTIELLLVGDSELMLHKKSRLYEMSEVFKQNSPKGTEMPEHFLGRNKWEQLITSLTWEKPITFHDDDVNLYTEEEWKYYMTNNRPCILTQAFAKSFQEAFKSFGFKDSTKKAGTDFQRALNFDGSRVPINFEKVETQSKLVPNTGINKTNVVFNGNIFHGWSTKIVLCMPDKVFPVQTVVSIVQTAGKYIGIGSQRKNGYGRYHIEDAICY